jgi:hypothetical protein
VVFCSSSELLSFDNIGCIYFCVPCQILLPDCFNNLPPLVSTSGFQVILNTAHHIKAHITVLANHLAKFPSCISHHQYTDPHAIAPTISRHNAFFTSILSITSSISLFLL